MLCCAAQHIHLLCLNHDIQLLTLAHISVILGRRQSWQPHIGHPGTMRQAGKQLYYSSGMAGSAEGEAVTPILMRLYAAQWPSVCRRIRQKQSHSYQRAYGLVETLLSLPLRKKSYFLSSLSISIITTLEKFWQIYLRLCIHNNAATTMTTHESCYSRNNNHCGSVSSRICYRLSTDKQWQITEIKWINFFSH